MLCCCGFDSSGLFCTIVGMRDWHGKGKGKGKRKRKREKMVLSCVLEVAAAVTLLVSTKRPCMVLDNVLVTYEFRRNKDTAPVVVARINCCCLCYK